MMNRNFYFHSHWLRGAAIVAALLLPGCTAAPEAASLNTIRVHPVQLTHTVHFASNSAVVTPAEADGLRKFLREDRVVKSITLIAGDSPVAVARRAHVSETLDKLGFPHSAIRTDPSLTAAAVLISVGSEAAVPPSCPNWIVIGPYDASNASMSNLGCATRTDLYLMVANPRDLVAGHPLSPADAAPNMHAVEVYRSGKPAPSLGSAASTTASSTNGQ
jgi:pilus assembly protein CpaD